MKDYNWLLWKGVVEKPTLSGGNDGYPSESRTSGPSIHSLFLSFNVSDSSTYYVIHERLHKENLFICSRNTCIWQNKIDKLKQREKNKDNRNDVISMYRDESKVEREAKKSWKQSIADLTMKMETIKAFLNLSREICIRGKYLQPLILCWYWFWRYSWAEWAFYWVEMMRIELSLSIPHTLSSARADERVCEMKRVRSEEAKDESSKAYRRI